MKKFIQHSVIVMSMMLLVGCQQTAMETDMTQSKESQASEFIEQNTHTVIDQVNREIILPKEVEKIVSCYYVSTATLLALDARDQLVGIELQADTRHLYIEAEPSMLELDAVGSGKSIHLEQVLALDPDVVIIPTRLMEYIPSLEESDIEVIVVSPESKEELLRMFELLGEITGKEKKAEALIDYYVNLLNEIEELNLEATQSVYLSSNSSYLSSATDNMYQDYLIEKAGGIHVADGLQDTYWATISPEQLLLYNPDVWLVAQGSAYEIEEILNDKAFADINAVQNHEIYEIPSYLEGWDYPTASAILGIIWTTHILHPEIYTSEMLKEEVSYFYKTFFDLEIDIDRVLPDTSLKQK